MARRRRPRPRGWYVKDGDPAGTERFWDGEKWGPQPRQMKEPPVPKIRPERGSARRSAAATAGKPDPKGQGGRQEGDGAPPLTVPRGTIMARITARSTDALLLMLPFYYLFSRAFSVEVTLESETVTRNDVFLWLMALLVIGYEVIFTGVWGWTPGKRLVGLAIVDPESGLSPGWGKVVMRSTPLMVVVTLLFIPVLWVVCVITMKFDKKQRSVLDFVGGTAVVAVPRVR